MLSLRPAQPRRRVSRLAAPLLAPVILSTSALTCAVLSSAPVAAAPALTLLHTFNAHSDGVNPTQDDVLLLGSDGNLYGVTSGGGTNNGGVLYRLTSAGVYTTLHSFTNSVDGYNPIGKLIQGKDGYLYGVTNSGGTNGDGAVYKCETDGSHFSVIHDFNNSSGDGYSANIGVVQAADGYLYGATNGGGTNGYGAFYKLSTDGTKFTVLQAVQSALGQNFPDTLVASGTTLYGVSYYGGANNAGAVFTLTTSGSSYKLLYSYGGSNAGEGNNPLGVALDTDGNLYVSCKYGGGGGYGAITRLKPGSTSASLVYQFSAGSSDGAYPTTGLSHDSSGNLYVVTYNGGAANSGVFERISTGGSARLYVSFPASTYTTAAPTLASASSPSTFYEPTYQGGLANSGSVLKLSTSSETSLYDFSNGFFDGSRPYQGGLIQGSDGLLYGTTSWQVLNTSVGTAFNISKSGTYTQLASIPGGPTGFLVPANDTFFGLTSNGGYYGSGSLFDLDSSADNGYDDYADLGQGAGTNPYGGAMLAKDGYIYTTTYSGGKMNDGAIIRFDVDGIETILHSFDGTHGANPNATLVQDPSSGTFYGTTYSGGANNDGTIFSFTPTGGVKVLASLSSTTGYNPADRVVLDTSGNLYVTARYGAAYGQGSVIREKTTGGTPTTIYSFGAQSNNADGVQPFAGLILATDGRLYGTTTYGGGSNNNSGVIFSVSTSGSYRLVHALAADGSEGAQPYAGVFEANDGNLYGVTNVGGVQPYPNTDVEGTAFKLAIMLPLVKSYTPTHGTSGTKVTITGLNFTGASAVLFNGVSATYTVNSDTEITATVPSGNTAGLLVVKNAGGQGTAATVFNVPSVSSFTPTSAKAGATVTITGTAFTNATAVTFNGISAKFSVKSDTSITATVPSGSATGKIAVTNSGGTGTSSGTFTVSS